MRILVLGTTGTRRVEYIRAVGDLFLKKTKGLSIDSDYAEKHVRIEELEQEIKILHNDQGVTGQKRHLTTFLDLPRQSQFVRWKLAAETILKRIDDFGKSDDQALFFLMHGEYYRHKQLFSCFSWDYLLRLAPDVIVTLIDDVYDIRTRINDEEQRLPTKSEVDIGEVLLWRSSETNLGDELAHNLYLNKNTLGLEKVQMQEVLESLFRPQPLRHFVIAVKHQPNALYKILFEKKTLIVYASFPITSTREHEERINEINKFRINIAEQFATLDPVTIDELRIGKKARLTPRWPLDYEPVVPGVRDTVSEEERDQYSQVIAAQIEERDYRLVEDSTCVAAYRPFFGQRADPAHGVEAEIQRALFRGREKVIYHPPDDGLLSELKTKLEVLGVITKVPAYNNYEGFINHLKTIQSHL